MSDSQMEQDIARPGDEGRKPSGGMKRLNDVKELLANGVVRQNPILVQLLGICPMLAVSTSLKNGVGMGIASTAVLICSNVVISLLRGVIHPKIRIVVYIAVIAGFVTAADLLLNAFAHDLWLSLGIFIPLIVVNCMILARAEVFASKNSVWRSALDGLGMGLGFTLAICLVSSIREILGNGTLYGQPILGSAYEPALILISPPGGFFCLAGLIAVVSKIVSVWRKRS